MLTGSPRIPSITREEEPLLPRRRRLSPRQRRVGTRRNARERVEPRPGTYALLLSSTANDEIQIGKRGKLRLRPGYYLYVGSALGPGGLRARLAHHLRPAERPHWHIDYLRAHTIPEQVWFSYHLRSREHAWARCISAISSVSAPMAGFGSSDCRCETHLFFFRQRPRPADLHFRGLPGGAPTIGDVARPTAD